VIDRRTFVAGLSALLTAPLAAEAQPAAKVWRIGFLSISSHEHIAHPLRTLEEGLRELGYAEGQHVAFEHRFAGGKPERLSELASELLQRRVSIIVAYGATSTRAAKAATTAIPIVMIVHPDPVSAGLVASLAHPGGNITGLARLSQELSAKRLALLKEAVPGLTRVAALWYSPSRDGEHSLKQTEEAARSLGIQVHVRAIRNPNELEGTFATMKEGRAGGLITVPSTMLSDNRTTVAGLALKQRLPAIFPEREFVEAGGLMAYGASLAEEFRRAATYVDKILKGAKPGDLPIEQPTKFELVINLKTAKALGLTIPPSLLVRADQVIE
jgi:putative ABC transport system substrate-binding protein